MNAPMSIDFRTGMTGRSATVLHQIGCGGEGTGFEALVRARGFFDERPDVSWKVIETVAPPGVPPSRAIQLRPDLLPSTPTGRLADIVAMTGLTASEYQRLRDLVGARGLSRLPAMSLIVSMLELDRIKESVESDVRGTSQAIGGARSGLVVTYASLVGGTGTVAARVAGLAVRLAARGSAMPADTRWEHVVITSSILGPDKTRRRSLALERQQVSELMDAMRPGASLTVPGIPTPISMPGPDRVWLIGSSSEAPRSLEEAADEMAGVLTNLLSA